MPDLLTAVQVAFLQALEAAAGVTDPIYQHVPETTPPVQPPFHVIGAISAEPVGGKDGGLDRVTVDIGTLVREPDRTALFSGMTAVRDALDGVPLPPQAGALLSPPVYESGEEDLLEDAQTYLGTQRFSLFVQPAD